MALPLCFSLTKLSLRLGSSSSTRDFRFCLQNATFQSQIVNLVLETEAISKGNFPLDYLLR
jgi:hypothetical protein